MHNGASAFIHCIYSLYVHGAAPDLAYVQPRASALTIMWQLISARAPRHYSLARCQPH